MKNLLKIPTKLEIQISATKMFPDDADLRASFIKGVQYTIKKMQTKKSNICQTN